MRYPLLGALFVLPCLTLPALAESAPHKPRPAHARTTLQQHFAQANTAHDGHLTLAEARAGYPSLSTHFAEIDQGGKGFITIDEIKAWHKQLRAQHQRAPGNKLRPRAAVFHPTEAHPTLRASTPDVVPGRTITVGPDAPSDWRAPG